MATTVMNGNDCFKNGNDRLRKGKLHRRARAVTDKQRGQTFAHA